MSASLLKLYESHVLGDGRGLGSTKSVASKKELEGVPPESIAQRRKRVHHDRTQALEIRKKIQQFRQLGPCDHD